KIPAWQKSESQRLSLPTRYSLVNEPPAPLGLTAFSQRRGAGLCTLSQPLSTTFFPFREIFFRCSGKVPAQSREVQSSRTPINCQSLFYNFFEIP
ncbi:hypothetical protein, partial [uncultured Desulfovibrio sp.]|uniref:hypothetical protein n=1 Tax=uncultured Desulfovibrio sp. TaxID=167968 RepID=UPI00266F7C81